jgi:putative component of membrane protein insertase Oxa1/YidC/SpoIIIJ protein YidD
MKCFIFLLALFMTLGLAAQEKPGDLNSLLVDKTFSYYNIPQKNHRKFVSLKNKKTIAKINPITYVGAGLLFFYQNILSEQIQANCNYEISCSNYTKLCIEHYGFIKGSLQGLHQLSNCFPSSLDECARYKITGNLKIDNQIEPD